MSLLSLSHSLTPAEMVQWTIRIYTRYLPQWIMLTLLALIVPLALGAVAVSMQSDIDPALLDRLRQPLDPTAPDSPLNDPAFLQQMTDFFIRQGVMALLLGAVSILMQQVVLGGAGAVLASAAFHGRSASLGEALRVLGERAGALLTGHLIVIGLLIALLLISSLGLLICVGVLGLALLPYLYLAGVPLLAPVLALERGPLSTLLRRAWQFGKRRVWLLLAAVVVLAVWAFVVEFVVGLVGGLFLGPVLNGTGTAAVLAGQVLTFISAVVVLPPGAIFYTLLYEDSRMRFAPQVVEEALPMEEPLLAAADVPNMIGVAVVAGSVLVGMYFVLMVLGMFAGLF